MAKPDPLTIFLPLRFHTMENPSRGDKRGQSQRGVDARQPGTPPPPGPPLKSFFPGFLGSD